MNSQKGFTLLLAALISSIVLALGTAIFQIAQKEIQLSSIGRDSQFAFYAADTAAECALYWDFRCNYFATSTTGIYASCGSPNPTCNAQAMNATGRPVQGAPSPYPYTMTSVKMNLFQGVIPGPFCAEVYVEKTLDAVSGAIRTTIHADGYSTSCETINTNADALQRTVELHY